MFFFTRTPVGPSSAEIPLQAELRGRYMDDVSNKKHYIVFSD